MRCKKFAFFFFFFFLFLVRIIGGGFCLVTKTSESSLFVGSINHGICFANTKKKKMEKEVGKHNFESLELKPVFVKRTWMDLKNQ
jgi:hypothetical protein